MQKINRSSRILFILAALGAGVQLTNIPVDAQFRKVHRSSRAEDMGYEAEVVDKAKNSSAYSFVRRELSEFVRGNLKQTIFYADLAVRKDSKLAIAYALRGMAYFELEETQKAIDDMCRAEALDPTVGKLHFADVRSRAYIELQRWQAAVADIDRAISYSPKEPWRYKERGEVYYTWHKYDLALRDFTTAIKLDPKPSWLFRTRAECYAGMHKYKEALADYNEVLRLGGDDAMTYGCRADIYEKLGKKDLAAKDRAMSNHKGFEYMEQKEPSGLAPAGLPPTKRVPGH